MNTTAKISAALAAAAISAAFMGYSTSANAASSSLDKCRGSSHSIVAQCCQTWVKQNGKPQWMRGNNLSCTTAVVCQTNWSGGTATCQIDYTPPGNGGHNPPPPTNNPNNPPPNNPPPNNPPPTGPKLT